MNPVLSRMHSSQLVQIFFSRSGLDWLTCWCCCCYISRGVTCPPEWQQFLASLNWMHWPLHHAGWVGIELWSAVTEIALMISIRRDQGLLEGYCAGGLMKGWGLLWGSERRFWIMMIKPSFVFHHVPLMEALTWGRKGGGHAPQDIFLSDEQRN